MSQWPTLSLCIQLQPQQVVGDRTQASVALVSHDAPVHGLQDAQRLSDLPATQPLLQQLAWTHLAPSQSPCVTWRQSLVLIYYLMR